MIPVAIDLCAGCGGMSEGIRQAGFRVIAAVEIDQHASRTYRLNHPETQLLEQDIRTVDPQTFKEILGDQQLHLLAACPPCQGFSSIRRLNRDQPVDDHRNDLILEVLRLVEALRPFVVMLENVPGLVDYKLFSLMVKRVEQAGYYVDYRVLNVADYEVPQRRKRLVLMASLRPGLKVPQLNLPRKTVRDIIGQLESVEVTSDPVHRIYPRHRNKVQERIALTPKDGGSRSDLPETYQLSCHKRPNVGFHDVYGRLRWNDVSATITGGCLNPSKGRFLHPEENRCITAREAALLQTFPPDYRFPYDMPRQAIASQIGNALPPKFCFHHAKHILHHILSELAKGVTLRETLPRALADESIRTRSPVVKMLAADYQQGVSGNE